mmetsp:Transcript_1896/g.4373  ORF Transcript_1896/g.4373 Transcript_1896/m.4373 type:complete len:329 (-) Transcript_1896:1228-2214(-)|eukprot:g8145.t1
MTGSGAKIGGVDVAALAPVITAVVAVLATFFFWFKTQRGGIVLQKNQKLDLQISQIVKVSDDTKQIRLAFPRSGMTLGLPVGKHFKIYAPNPGKNQKTWNGREDPEAGKSVIERAYTPVTGDEVRGYVDLVIKMYRPAKVTMPDGRVMVWDDGGKLSGCILDKKKVGDYVTISGPFGLLNYIGRGSFKLPAAAGTKTFRHVGMMAGGSGLTPMLQILQAAQRDADDTTTFSLLYANKTESDILCQDMLLDIAKKSKGKIEVHFTLDFPPTGWTGENGFISQDMIKRCLPSLDNKPLFLLCGPPPMVEFACKKNLQALGVDMKTNVACF